MRVAHVDPFSGASGDMFLGALIDAGVSLAELNRELAALGLPEARVEAESISRSGMTGTLATVPAEIGHHARSWRDIRAIIDTADVSAATKTESLRIFQRLAEAEAAVHGVPIDDVQFHEVGALDTIVDIVGAVIGLRLLGIEQLSCGPLRVGGGSVVSAHGLLPVPAPATARLLTTATATIATPIPGETDAGELLTPTGAAILTTLASFDRPQMSVETIGTGFGSKQLPWPNICRLMIGNRVEADAPSGEQLIVLDTNIDDMNPQFVEILLERLLASGALDAWTTPIGMKKGRPALKMSALARPADAERLVELLILESTTLGVRQTTVNRIAAGRHMESVDTRWGAIRIKLKIWNNRVIQIAPEYDDCAAIARAQAIAVGDVWHEAHLIGQVFVGRRIDARGEFARLDAMESSGGRRSGS